MCARECMCVQDVRACTWQTYYRLRAFTPAVALCPPSMSSISEILYLQYLFSEGPLLTTLSKWSLTPSLYPVLSSSLCYLCISQDGLVDAVITNHPQVSAV